LDRFWSWIAKYLPKPCNLQPFTAKDQQSLRIMTIDLLIALVTFAFVTSITPGPNNMLLLASGANFGFRRTLPHMLGISFGHALMVMLLGFGLAQVFHAVPPLMTALKVLSVAYMLWLAWKIANAGEPQARVAAVPMTFVQAAGFQWVNPKAWAMALGAVSAYAADGGVVQVMIVAGVFCAVNLPSVTVWAAMGEALRSFLSQPSRLRAFNWTMAGLLIVSLVPILRM
jgi:threonine/homoserine/homoserine lactone efflux protein